EGFATFGEHVAYEKLLMTNAEFLNYLLGEKNYITSATDGSVYVADSNLGNVGSIFNGRLTYSKGGYVVRMMKWILGDTVFYQALKDYHARPNLAYNYVRTSDLNASFLTSTGINFTEFFNDWIYGQGYPTYDIRWEQIGNEVTFKASQTQSHSSVSFFEMPLPIKVTGTGGQTAFFALNNTSNNQFFNETVSFPIASVQFNYEYQILEKNSTVTQDNNLSTTDFKTQEFSIYPNPAKNELFISGLKKEANYQIFTADGRLVKKGKTNQKIDIAVLDKGVYFIMINNSNLKFVKE
ncbi:MAG TPA: T9SS type A sorting domain-containing protein, partial [Chryseobacterium sp.]